MSERQPKTVFFTVKETAVLDALIEAGNYKRAKEKLSADGLNMSLGNMRGMTLRIRNRYNDAKRFVEICERYQTALSRKDRKRRYITG